MNEKRYTIKEAAKLLQLSKDVVRQNIYKGKIKAVKINDKWEMTENELQKLKLVYGGAK